MAQQIMFCGAFAGLLLVLSGCASTSERSSTQALRVEETSRTHEQVGVVVFSRKQWPELNEASGLNDYLAYAALNNPQLKAAFNRWKANLEMVSQARTLPDPRFNYSYFIQEVETRVGPQTQGVGISQMFPWFGKLKLRNEAALGGANAMQQQYEAAKLRLFDEVKQAYYELYYLGRAVDVTTENVELLTSGPDVLVSARRALSGSDLGQLRDAVEKEFLTLDEHEQSARKVMAKLETGFLRRFATFQHE